MSEPRGEHGEFFAKCPTCDKDSWSLSSFEGAWILCDCGTVFMLTNGESARFHAKMVLKEPRRTAVFTRVQ